MSALFPFFRFREKKDSSPVLMSSEFFRWFHRLIPGMPRYGLAFLHLRQPCAQYSVMRVTQYIQIDFVSDIAFCTGLR